MQENQVFCADILGLLTKDFFARKGGDSLSNEGENAGGGQDAVEVKQNYCIRHFIIFLAYILP